MNRQLLACGLFCVAVLVPQTAFAQKKTYTKQFAFEVTVVNNGWPAAEQGLEVGDIILSIDSTPVRSGPDLRHLLQQVNGRARMEVVDVNTGRINIMLIRPVNGKIGVDGQQITYTGSNNGGGNDPTPYGSKKPIGSKKPVNNGPIPSGR